MVSIADRPIFFVHQTQKKNIDIYQKNRVCFILTPNITVEYTQTPKTVKIPVSVNDFFKSELKGFRTISTTYKIWMRTEKRFLAWSEPITVVNFGQIRKRFPIRTFFVLIDTAIIYSHRARTFIIEAHVCTL